MPFLVFAIGVSHGAQKMNGIMQDIGRGTHKLVAARYTFRRLFLAGLTALLADAVGFAVLMVIDIPVIKELALTASIGVAVLIFTNLLLLPVLLSYTGVSAQAAERSLREEKDETSGKGLGRVWLMLDRFTTRRWALGAIGVSAVLAVAGFAVSLNLKIGDLDPGAPELRPDSRYNRDNAYITANYALSSDQFAVIVKTAKEGCLKYETLVEADRLAWALQQVPGVQTTVSLADAARQITAGSFEGNPKWLTINRNQDVLNYAAQQASVNNPDLFNTECSVMPVIAYLADHKAETLDRVVQVAAEFADEHSDKDRQFLLAAGSAGIEAATNIVVQQANRTMLLYVYGAVILLCFVTFRSWRAVVVAVVPLMVTSILCEALMVALGIGVKVATLPVIALGVGIGVDYALYLLSVQLAQQRGGRTADRGVQEGRPVHRQGRRAGRRHARGRCRHLGLLADQVPGRHGDPADVHVRVEHDRRAGADSGAVALPAADRRGPQAACLERNRARLTDAQVVFCKEPPMNPLTITRTPSAHDAPLSIGQILDHGVAKAPDQEIVYGDRLRYTYTTLAERVRRLASALAALGVEPGSTVAIMDWDSHRYLECFFAVPMMGAVLHTVNVRISPEQVLYTINHAEDDVILVNAEFLPLLEAIHDEDPAGREVRADQRRRIAAGEQDRVRRRVRIDARARAPAVYAFPRARREHAGDDVLHDRHDRAAQGRLLQPSPARAAHDGVRAHALAQRAARDVHGGRRLHADHADVPRPRVGASVRRDAAGREAGLPGALRAGRAARPHRRARGSRSRTACRRSCR